MIPILYAGNRRMFDGLLISAVSAATHSTQPLDITLLTMDLREVSPEYLPLTENQRQYLERLCAERLPGSRVTLIDVGTYYRESLADSPNTETGYTPYCFLRLFADRLPLPDKILYLDADTVIADDLLPLFQTDIGNAEYAAVLDHYGRFFHGLSLHQFRRDALESQTHSRDRAVSACGGTLCRKAAVFTGPDSAAPPDAG